MEPGQVHPLLTVVHPLLTVVNPLLVRPEAQQPDAAQGRGYTQGTIVVLRNLSSRPELNGRRGTIVPSQQKHLQGGRITVRVDGQKLALKPANLQRP